MKQALEDNTARITIGREPMQIRLLAVGKGWLVAEKPAGMSVHNEPGGDLCSLVSAFIQNEPLIRERTGMDPDFGVNPVHRLDKETSGLILLALTRETFRFFSNQFESHQVKKRYIAILHGRLESAGGSSTWGTWAWLLPRPPVDAVIPRRRTPPGQLDAIPSARPQCPLHAGGNRVALGPHPPDSAPRETSGNPVIGDLRYGSTRAANYLRQNHAFDRLGLHARALTILLPDGKEPATIETPAIPRPMLDLFQNDSAAPEP